MEDEFDDTAGIPMILPPGVFSLLDCVKQADNAELPSGPWDMKTLKQRARAYQASKGPATVPESALADDSDDEDDGAAASADAATATSSFDQEFLVPFFISLPPENVTETSAKRGAGRRSSSVSSATSNSAFRRLTPLPSLRPSSPTHAHTPPVLDPSPPAQNLSSQPIGFLRPEVVKALIRDNQFMNSNNSKPVFAFYPPMHLPPPSRRPSTSSFSRSRRGSHVVSPKGTSTSQPGTPTSEVPPALSTSSRPLGMTELVRSLESISPEAPYAIAFEDWVNEEGASARQEHMDRLVRGWKAKDLFPECLRGWREEQYVIYGPAAPLNAYSNPLPGSNTAFRMERAATALFGFATFGVHMTAYLEPTEDKPLQVWVPRRSATKQTFPSLLDNTVAGGIQAGDSPRQSMLREAAEEASLDPRFVASALKFTSVVSYTYRTTQGWLQPEVEYCYDLLLPADGTVVPTTNPADGEVESFTLMPIDEVVQRMVDGEFKPNCSLVMCDFLLRHGYVTPETDVRFLELASRLRRFPVLPPPA